MIHMINLLILLLHLVLEIIELPQRFLVIAIERLLLGSKPHKLALRDRELFIEIR